MEKVEALLLEIVKDILDALLLKYDDVQVSLDNETYRVNISSPEDGGLIIGWHGEALSALQNLVKNMLAKKLDDKISLVIDVEDYKKNQEKNILELAERKARRVLETGSSELMPPMHPYFRRLVHTFFSENSDYELIKTMSKGEGRSRQIEIYKD